MLAQVALHRFPTRKQQDFLKLIDMSNQDSSFSLCLNCSISYGLRLNCYCLVVIWFIKSVLLVMSYTIMCQLHIVAVLCIQIYF